MMGTAAPQPVCPWCGSTIHKGTHCLRVRAFEYTDAGVVKRVEFHAPPGDVSELAQMMASIVEELKRLNSLLADDEKDEMP
jgi:hypothetical protein